MYKVGDLIVLNFCEQGEVNEAIVGKVVEVVEVHGARTPYWLSVAYDGQEYSVRGTQCRTVIKNTFKG